jgi:hypothetical protein
LPVWIVHPVFLMFILTTVKQWLTLANLNMQYSYLHSAKKNWLSKIDVNY